jgi:hypothetical protein
MLDKFKGTSWGGITRIYKHFTILTKTRISNKRLEENQHLIYTIHNTTEILDLVGKRGHFSPIEKCNVHAETKYNNQLKVQNTLEKLHLQSFVPTTSTNKASSPSRPSQQYVSFYLKQKKNHLHISHQQNHLRHFYTHIPYRKNNKNFYTFHW